MLIDQLPELNSLNDTDEVPVERGTTSYKAKISKWATNLNLVVITTTTIEDIATSGTNFTISSANYATYGKIAQLRIVFSPSSDVTSGNSTVAIMVSGKRPSFNTLATCHTNHDIVAYINANGNVVVNGPMTANSSYTVYSTYILA